MILPTISKDVWFVNNHFFCQSMVAVNQEG